ncbi:uncharacterized protein LOC131158621 [Malania oleifera]|uniref:uncharacterized protein LOC131158621 n=1 Tax=Malania oleifera TaxID=397392 RepID=UPI0025ADCCF2|nr:uncharacterized protein LOC131158621 [Malania oleifera]
MAFNPLDVILKENKLVGPNYIDWKRNLNIVLTAKEYKYVLIEVSPQKPNEKATDEETQAYWKCIKADEMAWSYILNFKEMFGDQNHVAKQIAMKELMNNTMVEVYAFYLVRNHVLKMIGLLNEHEILGAEIDWETQVDIILQSLPDSFKQFFLNYNMSKLSHSLAELIEEL